MQATLEFPDLLRLIDERSTAFRAAVASAASLDVQVPTCPDWTLFDLVKHLGDGRRAWAATIAAGPHATAKAAAEGAPAAPREREALLAWLAASTQELLDALREAGPDRGCWTWWGTSQSPQTCGAVARHQLQEIAVHTYDAQLSVRAPQPLPVEVALDGVDEFLSTCVATTEAWPHEAAAVDYHATEGRSWRLWLSADGARTARLPTQGAMPGRGRGRRLRQPHGRRANPGFLRPHAGGLPEGRPRPTSLRSARGLGAGLGVLPIIAACDGPKRRLGSR
ncbi:MAG TPA: maleylpyruvate isomerase N-terminal domain-containing protein [Asanoa sp.]|nr:maleylpyruvate isomerase N-terminal domain-containing protein [Asanoa sp.]